MTFSIERLILLAFLPLWIIPGIAIAYSVKTKLGLSDTLSGQPLATILMGLFTNLLVSLFFVFLPSPLDQIFRTAYLVIGFLWAVFLVSRLKPSVGLKANFILLALGVLLLAGQFHFSNQLIFPSFTDSITHYRYIKHFLDWRVKGLNVWEFISQLRFYHYGFHLIASEIHHLTGYAITDIMLTIGTWLIVLAPFTLALPLKQLGVSTANRRWAILLIGLVFVFPDFALNWGKYPAILSVVLLPMSLSLILGIIKQPHKENNWVRWIVLLALLGLTGLSHWRSLVVLAAMTLVVIIFHKFFKKNIPIAVSGVLVFGALFFLVKDRGRFNVSGGQLVFWILVLFVALFVLFVQTKRKESNLLPLTIALYLAVRFLVEIPLGKLLPQIGAPVDMPYFRIVLFIIAGLFMGVLISELKALLLDRQEFLLTKKHYLKDIVVLMFVSLLIFAVPIQRKWQPSRTYILLGSQQKEAIDWALETFEGHKVKLLLAGTPELDYVEYADAGGWLAEMGDFDIVFAIDSVDLNRSGVHARMCREDVGLVFADYSRATVFSPKVMLDPELYDTLFETEDVRLISPKCE